MSVEETLKDILSKIERDRKLYSNNEQLVCDDLVRPLLVALGWEKGRIMPQKSGGDGRPDYSLYLDKDIDKPPILLVEVKSLGTPFSKDVIIQLFKYLIQGVKYGLLTDGVKYCLYKAFEVGKKPEENLLWEFSLEGESNFAIEYINLIAHDKINGFDENFAELKGTITVWKEEQRRKEEKHLEIEKAMAEIWKEMIEKKDDLLLAITSQFRQNLDHDRPHLEFDDTLIQDFVRKQIEIFLAGISNPIAQNHIGTELDVGGRGTNKTTRSKRKLVNRARGGDSNSNRSDEPMRCTPSLGQVLV